MCPDLLLRIHGGRREDICSWNEFEEEEEEEEFLKVGSNVRNQCEQRKMMLGMIFSC